MENRQHPICEHRRNSCNAELSLALRVHNSCGRRRDTYNLVSFNLMLYMVGILLAGFVPKPSAVGLTARVDKSDQTIAAVQRPSDRFRNLTGISRAVYGSFDKRPAPPNPVAIASVH